MNTRKSLKNQVGKLPKQPGVYLFFDTNKKILYIGKAKSLRQRVSSYFQKSNSLAEDKRLMVSRITRIDYIIVDSEFEALMLEASLISKHKPPFNIVLKDDKSYVYVKTTKEKHPRVYITRDIENDKAKYFGPYSSRYSIEKTLEAIRKVFPFRSCRVLPQRPCLYFHIKQCPAPCLLEVKKKSRKYDLSLIAEVHNHNIKQIRAFLGGKTTVITKDIRDKMDSAKEKRSYELAIVYRNQLQAITKIASKQKVVSNRKENQDIISLKTNKKLALVNLFIIREGRLLDKRQFKLSIKGQEKSIILEEFVKQYYRNQSELPTELIIPYKIELGLNSLNKLCINRAPGNRFKKIVVPQRGKKLKLIKMGEKNLEFQKPKTKQIIKETSLEALQRIIRIKSKLQRIECYDISNLAGKFSVGAMVVMTEGEIDKSQYRKFKIRTVKGISDVDSMAEIINRRLGHLDPTDKQYWPKPNLIIIDGGKPQLNTVMKTMQEGNAVIPVITLAKKQEEIFTPNRKTPLKLDKKSPASLLVQQLRNEAHRFGISYHKLLRKKGFLENSKNYKK